MFSAVAWACMSQNISMKNTRRSALPDAYVEHGNVSVLREMLGINSDSVIRRIETEFLNEKR